VSDQTTPVAVLSRSFSKQPTLRAELAARWGNVVFNDGDTTLSGEALTGFLHGKTHAVVALEKIDDATLAALPDLKVIAKYGVGCDNIDLAACARRGIKVGWTGGVNRLSVAELTLSLAIAALRRVGEGMLQVRGGGWKQLQGRQLSGRTIGLVGFGHVGQEVARLLAPFHCTILAHDIRDMSGPAAALGATLATLDKVLAQSDVVSLHLPSTAATRHIIDPAALGRMRQDAVLLNTARGGVIDDEALYEALSSGRLAAAALDVLEVEPPTYLRLIGLPNVIVTPHIGGSAQEAVLAMGRAAIEGLETAGDPLSLIPSYLTSQAG